MDEKIDVLVKFLWDETEAGRLKWDYITCGDGDRWFDTIETNWKNVVRVRLRDEGEYLLEIHGRNKSSDWYSIGCFKPVSKNLFAALIKAVENQTNEKLFSGLIDEIMGAGIEPGQYSGHVRCEKCGQVHWMHGPCPQMKCSTHGTDYQVGCPECVVAIDSKGGEK